MTAMVPFEQEVESMIPPGLGIGSRSSWQPKTAGIVLSEQTAVRISLCHQQSSVPNPLKGRGCSLSHFKYPSRIPHSVYGQTLQPSPWLLWRTSGFVLLCSRPGNIAGNSGKASDRPGTPVASQTRASRIFQKGPQK